MDYAIILCFDKDTELYFNKIINSISDSGVSSYMTDVKIPPHITITYFGTEKSELIINELDNKISNFNSGNVIWASLGAFVPNVLFAAPVINEYLLNACININQLIKPFSDYGDIGHYYLPYSWMPHTTLATQLNNDGLKRAFDIASQQFNALSGKINRILFVECNPYRELKMWNLI